MKKPQKSRRALVAALAAGVVIALIGFAGCADRDVSTGPASAPQSDAIDKVPDVTEVTSRGESNFYSAGNPYTDVTVKRLLGLNDVSRAIARFQDMGMRVAPEDCAVVEGINNEGTMTATFVALSPRSPDAVESGVLLCVERGGRRVLVPATFATEPGRSGGDIQVTDGIWMNGAPFSGPNTSPEDTERWSPQQWNNFWMCLLDSAPGPMVACTVGCVFAGPGYVTCVVTCMVTQSAAAVVRCAAHIAITPVTTGDDRCEQ